MTGVPASDHRASVNPWPSELRKELSGFAPLRLCVFFLGGGTAESGQSVRSQAPSPTLRCECSIQDEGMPQLVRPAVGVVAVDLHRHLVRADNHTEERRPRLAASLDLRLIVSIAGGGIILVLGVELGQGLGNRLVLQLEVFEPVVDVVWVIAVELAQGVRLADTLLPSLLDGEFDGRIHLIRIRGFLETPRMALDRAATDR